MVDVLRERQIAQYLELLKIAKGRSQRDLEAIKTVLLQAEQDNKNEAAGEAVRRFEREQM
jgi:hypothetical protein